MTEVDLVLLMLGSGAVSSIIGTVIAPIGMRFLFKDKNPIVVGVDKNFIEMIKRTDAKLDEIHILVNSNLSAVKLARDAALRAELSALEGTINLLNEVAGLKAQRGDIPSHHNGVRLTETRGRITELKKILKGQDVV